MKSTIDTSHPAGFPRWNIWSKLFYTEEDFEDDFEDFWGTVELSN